MENRMEQDIGEIYERRCEDFLEVVYQTSFVEIQSGGREKDDSKLFRNRSDAKRGVSIEGIGYCRFGSRRFAKVRGV